MLKNIKIILITVGILILVGCTKREIKFVSIGTGGVTGVYYPTGGAICRMINNQADKYNIKATFESTGGSVFNINAVLQGDLEFGIAQSDRQYQAFNGTAEWKEKGKQQKLRAVFSIHPESITLIASEKSGIKNIADLKGKKVNMGNPGSGHLQNARDLLNAFKINEASIYAEYIKAAEAPGLLQDNRIDAFFYTVGHPNGAIKEATSGRIKVRLIPLTGESVASLIREKPYYAESTILKEFYPNSVNEADINSIGVKATLITSSDVEKEVVYAITKEVFEHLEEFKKLHPAYSVLTAENMLQGLSAPIHEGAMQYYIEAGLDLYLK